MADCDPTVLQRDVAYVGDGISVRSLEQEIHAARGWQQARVDQVAGLRAQSRDLQATLVTEIEALRTTTREAWADPSAEDFWTRLQRSFLSLFGRNETRSHRSVEDLLRQQYALSARRVKEAAEFADRLEIAETELHDEIDRLNTRIIESARNEELAASYVLAVETYRGELESRLAATPPGSTTAREFQAELDRCRRQIAQHSTPLKLYGTAEDRLARLKESTARLATTIANLRSDITHYVTAASEKLDLVGGQIQAVGAAADASVMVMDLRQALDAMSDSLNAATRA